MRTDIIYELLAVVLFGWMALNHPNGIMRYTALAVAVLSAAACVFYYFAEFTK